MAPSIFIPVRKGLLYEYCFKMKIRIQGNTVRLRLTQPEVDLLRKEDSVKQSTEFENGNVFQYGISFSSLVELVTANFLDGRIHIEVPTTIGNQWINSSKAGIENSEYTNQGPGLKILIEKDFQCLHERENEDETEAFPNPLAKEEGV